jgi:hypothetical protein
MESSTVVVILIKIASVAMAIVDQAMDVNAVDAANCETIIL